MTTKSITELRKEEWIYKHFNCKHEQFKYHTLQFKKWGLFMCLKTEYLVFWVWRVDALAVSAGLEQDVNSIELQQDFTCHAIKECDVCQCCWGQQKHFTTGSTLTQICRHTCKKKRWNTGNHLVSFFKMSSLLVIWIRTGSLKKIWMLTMLLLKPKSKSKHLKWVKLRKEGEMHPCAESFLKGEIWYQIQNR